MRWSLFKDREKWVIRRWEDGKYKRLPVSKYRRIRDDFEALTEFVKRLNAPMDLRVKVDYKHAFVNDQLLSDYREYLAVHVPNQKDARAEFKRLDRYFLKYFISKLNLANPVDWHRVHDTKWASYLLSKEVPSSAKSKRAIVQAANRFCKWLHKRRPEDMPALVFDPIAKEMFKKIEAERELKDEVRDRKNIPDKDWEKIEEGLPDRLRPFAMIAYEYGLRRSEVCGLQNGDSNKTFLWVKRQLDRLTPEPSFKATKGKTTRKVPHWFGKAMETAERILVIEDNRMHPDTLTDLWNEYMDTLGLEYDFHDLRHTFITKAAVEEDLQDVQAAAGHAHQATTEGYIHREDELEDAPIILKRSA